jgi:hypothetical protein
MLIMYLVKLYLEPFHWEESILLRHICRQLQPVNRGANHKGSRSWLTNSALVYEPKCGGGGGNCGVSANEYSCGGHMEPK